MAWLRANTDPARPLNRMTSTPTRCSGRAADQRCCEASGGWVSGGDVGYFGCRRNNTTSRFDSVVSVTVRTLENSGSQVLPSCRSDRVRACSERCFVLTVLAAKVCRCRHWHPSQICRRRPWRRFVCARARYWTTHACRLVSTTGPTVAPVKTLVMVHLPLPDPCSSKAAPYCTPWQASPRMTGRVWWTDLCPVATPAAWRTFHSLPLSACASLRDSSGSASGNAARNLPSPPILVATA